MTTVVAHKTSFAPRLRTDELFGPDYNSMPAAQRIVALDGDIARRKFDLDRTAIERCDVCILVEPAGKSAHLEAGFAAGLSKRVIVLLDEAPAPVELMLAFASNFVTNISGLLRLLTAGTGSVPGSNFIREFCRRLELRTDAEHYERVCRLLGFGIRVQFVPGGRCDHCDAIATTLVLVRCEHPAVTVSVCTDCLEGDSVRAVVGLINRRTTKRTQPTMTIQRTAETDDLYTMLGGFVVNMCPKDTPWLTMDDDFVRDQLETYWKELLTPEAIAGAVAFITRP